MFVSRINTVPKDIALEPLTLPFNQNTSTLHQKTQKHSKRGILIHQGMFKYLHLHPSAMRARSNSRPGNSCLPQATVAKARESTIQQTYQDPSPRPETHMKAFVCADVNSKES